MVAAHLTCQASSPIHIGLKKFVSKPTYPVPAGGPLSLGWSKQTTNFAVSSNAMDAYPKWNSSSANFVRPDTDQSVEESWNAFNRSTKAAFPYPAHPQFRSALEQVSFETSENLMERVSVVKPRNSNQGLFGMAARIFGK